ncbi:four-carbon acid sugar kinase family protein [Streptomyces cyaneus]|uniref:four-carbon acid sugar kinase family protein n=1 Tax=Streptomyces cyaneus TaxID=1904 RepID=UPI001FE7B6BD|nr:four-carbon acid sugar kinase family protein [Streptomyces cyaneus]
MKNVSPSEVAARLRTAPRLAVLDDDPTGTQTVKDIPVLTTWAVEDLRWASRGDSTLRGHFPLETDVLTEELTAAGAAPDGVVLVPAYIRTRRCARPPSAWSSP